MLLVNREKYREELITETTNCCSTAVPVSSKRKLFKWQSTFHALVWDGWCKVLRFKLYSSKTTAEYWSGRTPGSICIQLWQELALPVVPAVQAHGIEHKHWRHSMEQIHWSRHMKSAPILWDRTPACDSSWLKDLVFTKSAWSELAKFPTSLSGERYAQNSTRIEAQTALCSGAQVLIVDPVHCPGHFGFDGEASCRDNIPSIYRRAARESIAHRIWRDRWDRTRKLLYAFPIVWRCTVARVGSMSYK